MAGLLQSAKWICTIRYTLNLTYLKSYKSRVLLQIQAEATKYKDIVQGDFLDTYFNNTLKSMMGLRWAAEQCPTARFYFFVDDDYYVSTRNVLRFLRNPVNYPAYLEDPVVSFDDEGVNQNQGKDSVSSGSE